MAIDEEKSEIGDVVAQRDRYAAALQKISDIRDEMIGTQTLHWSQHIYPMVAVLDEAGFAGKGYAIMQPKMATLIERVLAAEAEVQHLRKVLAFRDAFVPVQWGEDAEGRWWIVTLRDGLPHQAFHQQLGYLRKIPPDMFVRWAAVNIAMSPGDGPEVAALRAELARREALEASLAADVAWWRVLLLSITRHMVLSDHIGDAWGGLNEALKLAGFDIPTGDDGMPNLDALDAMGARMFWGPDCMPPREPTDD